MYTKRVLISVILGLLPFMTAVAGIIDEEAARQRAAEFLTAKNGAQARAEAGIGQRLTLANAIDRRGGFFVYNVGEGDGFVIVSGTDRVDGILGYSDSGSFDPDDLPDALRAWLDDYRCQMDYMERHGMTGPKQRPATKISVPELLKSRWDQTAPFNDRCPEYQGKRAVTGCVSTAMAQLMYYHKHPDASPAIEGYTSHTSSFGDIQMADLPATTFDWSKMYDTYKANEDATEMAKLFLYCGTAVQMNYGLNGSDAQASDAVDKLVELFGYDAGVRYVSRSNYYYSEWEQLVYNELSARRPVLFSGYSSSGGHAFICDGYDSSTDMYHINWGWGGLSNGFFRLSLLAPKDQGTGGSISDDGYNLSLSAGLGIQPDTGRPLTIDKSLTLRRLTLADTSYNKLTRNGGNANFCITPQLDLMNLSGGTHTYKFGARLCLGDSIVRTDAWENEGLTLAHNSGITQWRTFNFGRGLADGTYRLEAVYQVDDDRAWTLCKQGEQNYLLLTIDGNELKVEAVEQGTYQLEVLSVSYAHSEVTQGEPETVTITVRNTGSEPYHGDITFLTAWNSGKERWGGMATDIAPDDTVTVTIEHTPTHIGSFAARVYQGFFDRGVLLSEETLKIAQPSASTTDAELSFSVTVDNASGDKILGTTAKVKMTVTNNSAVLYRGAVFLCTWTWNGNSGSGEFKGYVETIPAQSTVVLERTVEGLLPGGTYSFSAAYQKGNVNMEDRTDAYTKYQTVAAFTAYDVTGNTSIVEAAEKIEVPAEAVCVDLRGQTTVKTIVPNDNPNVLFLMDGGAATPAGITANVVKGTVAENVVLTDGYAFYSPIVFMANNISYTRTFATGTNGIGGWTSLMIPFRATRVSVADGTAAGRTLDWYHDASEEGKDFWLRLFAGEDDGKPVFANDPRDAVGAYEPYIIAVPGDRWGEARNLVGKPLVFSAENAVVDKDRRIYYEGETFRFVGTLQTLDRAGFWRLNSEGTMFERTDGTLMPFRAVFTLKEAGIEALDAFPAPVLDESMGISATQASGSLASSNAAYHLDGTRIKTDAARQAHGIYIMNGKKVVR